jgi:hypothetical protein
VWSIRHLYERSASLRRHLTSDEQRRQRIVSRDDIKRAQQKSNNLRSLPSTDCKEVACRFRAYLWSTGFPSEEKESRKGKSLKFGQNTFFPIMLTCIEAIEKVRHKIPLDKPILMRYDWVIRENGSSAWKGLHITQTSNERVRIELNVIHLQPCENGYSKDYGFPNIKEFAENGFVDTFTLEGQQLIESFYENPFGPVPENFYYMNESIDYWDEDPYGWADYATESLYQD